jgi:predicted tellurium resistance membrane protein TerC
VVELLLSMDNICLFHQIFEHFKVPVEVRPGLLFIGTPFMVLMRFLLFFSIKGIYNSIRPLMFTIGLFCCYQGGVVLWMTVTGMEEEEEDFDAESSTVVQWFKSLLGDKLVTKYQGSAFYLTMDGALRYTPMFLVLLAIEVTDVAFCIDGVSTIFMVDHFHVWTLFVGDVVAACVVRALYPQLAGTVELFPDLNYSVAVVLLLVGIDMCCGVFGLDFPPGWLALSMGVLFALGMLSSVLRGVCRVAEQDQDTPDAVAEKQAEKNKAYGAA